VTSSARYSADHPLRARDPQATHEPTAGGSTPHEAPPGITERKAPSTTPSAARARGFLRRHGRAVTAVVAVAALAGFIRFVVPQLSALGPTVHRLRGADPKWLGIGAVLEALSLGGYVALFRTVFSCHDARIGWRASYQITMAGVVATKLFTAAGAGGVALTVWALRASGLDARTVARRVLTFEFILYGVYAMAVVVAGVGLRTRLFAGGAPWTLTVAPAVLGAALIAALISIRALPNGFERRARPLGRAPRTPPAGATRERAPGGLRRARHRISADEGAQAGADGCDPSACPPAS
jgi:uncharacterized membrane protein YbhN (UPF0104 family)